MAETPIVPAGAERARMEERAMSDIVEQARWWAKTAAVQAISDHQVEVVLNECADEIERLRTIMRPCETCHFTHDPDLVECPVCERDILRDRLKRVEEALQHVKACDYDQRVPAALAIIREARDE